MIYPRHAPDAQSVAQHYDELSEYYVRVWGEHVHHGLWLTGDESPDEAVDGLVHELARRTGITSGDRICDVGCGYGATSRLLARDYGAEVVGLTVSEAQYAESGAQAPPDGNPQILCQDWLSNDFPDASFDVVISIESSEHMVDKARFFSEAHRVLRPGGRLGVYAWLAKHAPKRLEVKHLLEPICREGCLPSMGSEADYQALLHQGGFEQTAFKDFSRQVRRTWSICVGRMLKVLMTDGEARRFLLKGPESRVFAKTVARIWLAYRFGSMRYGLFTARKAG